MRALLPPLLVATLVLPTPAFSAGRVDIQDTIAGLETSARLEGLAADAAAELLLTTPYGDTIILPAHTDATGFAIVRIPAGLAEEAGTYRAAGAHDGVRVTGETQYQVLPDRVSETASRMEADRSVLRADGRDQARVSVTLSDRYGNLLPGRPVELISNRPSDRIAALARETDEVGTVSFALRAEEAGAVDLRAMDLLSGLTLASGLRLIAEDARGAGGNAPSRSPYAAQITSDRAFPTSPSSVAPTQGTGDAASAGTTDGAVKFRIAVTPDDPRMGDVVDLSVTALRADGSVAVSYTRTPSIFAPNDPAAVLPGFGTLIFQRQENGRDRCLQCVSFGTPGPQKLVVEDTLPTGNVIRGELSLEVTTSAEYQQTQKIEVLSHRDGAAISSPNIVIEGIGPKLANIRVTGGVSDMQTETDSKGYFSLPIALDPTYNEYTLRVQAVNEDPDTGSERVTHDSGPLHLVRDASGPEVEFSFDPPEPFENQDVALTVLSEPRLPEVTMLLRGREISLSEDPDKEGTYRVVFQAPKTGQYQPAIVAKDGAENRTELRASLKVKKRELPRVLNLRAAPKSKSIDLSWDPIEGDEISSYIVSVGTDAEAFSSMLDTKDARTSVSVKGLKSGKKYAFAVTAVSADGRKSERSDTVSATTPGLWLTVTPGPSTLILEWDYTDVGTPLKEYLIEFGDKPTIYTNALAPVPAAEPLPGPDGVQVARQRYEIKDLIGGVTYHVRLSPVTTTGEYVPDMVTLGEGTPIGTEGFVPSSPGNPLPFNFALATRPGPLPDTFHGGAPSTPSSGLPAMAVAGAAALGGIVFWIRRRRVLHARTQEFLRTMGNRYHG